MTTRQTYPTLLTASLLCSISLLSCTAQNDNNSDPASNPVRHDTLVFYKMTKDLQLHTDSLVIVQTYAGDTIYRLLINNGQPDTLNKLVKSGNSTLVYRHGEKNSRVKYNKELYETVYWQQIKSGEAKKGKEIHMTMWNLSIWNNPENIFTVNNKTYYQHWVGIPKLAPQHLFYYLFDENGALVMQTVYKEGGNTAIDENCYYLKSLVNDIEQYGIKPFDKK